MKPQIIHDWNLSCEEAKRLQVELSSKVVKHDDFAEIHTIAGVDVAYDKESDKLVAAIVILGATSLEEIESHTALSTSQFDYIPGLFSFREIPALSLALEKTKITPDLIVCDAQGIAHPKRFGLASHLGVIYDIPTIGCSKTILIGEAENPASKRGSISPLYDGEEVVGNVLRTQDDVNSVYVSIGHRISLESACDWILKLSPKYRLPETTRQADQLVNKLLKTI